MRTIHKHLATWCMIWGSSTIFLLSGCGKGVVEAELAPAEGLVRINGKPAENILVQFLPVVPDGEPGPTSTGVSNAAGEFELTTTDGKLGAVVGRCKVLLVDMTEERAPQGVEAKPPRIPSNLAVVSPQSREVEVRLTNSPFQFDIQN